MSALSEEHMVLLQRRLEEDYVPHLPALLEVKKDKADIDIKNRSRALSAFTLSHICEIESTEASRAVVDDFGDQGIDAIYYHHAASCLYLVQSKLKASEKFKEEEALAFSRGVQRLLNLDFAEFNKHVQDRAVEIESALEECNSIKLVIAYTGDGVTGPAYAEFKRLLNGETLDDERVAAEVTVISAEAIVKALHVQMAYQPVNTDIHLHRHSKVHEPKTIYYGTVPVMDLVKLHNDKGKALYEKNIRYFLGTTRSDVNRSIQKTLQERPADFFLLNNGVTALCDVVEPKLPRKEKIRLKVRGLSIINGAQTIASSAEFVGKNPQIDISSAKVLFTLIHVDHSSQFGQDITRARNHQNPVQDANFVSLDWQQERLRRELAHLGITYHYRPESISHPSPTSINLQEAVTALALSLDDPRYAIWLKKEPSRLFDTNSDAYKVMFSESRTAQYLANSVFVARIIQKTISETVGRKRDVENQIYSHGQYAILWVFMKRIKPLFETPELQDEASLVALTSHSFDELRLQAVELCKKELTRLNASPLAFFKNQATAIPYLSDLLEVNFKLSEDSVITIKKGIHITDEVYPKALFDYLISKRPTIRTKI